MLKVNTIEINHKLIRWEAVDWVQLAQDKAQRRVLLNSVMNMAVT
jgi:hypothetical protein